MQQSIRDRPAYYDCVGTAAAARGCGCPPAEGGSAGGFRTSTVRQFQRQPDCIEHWVWVSPVHGLMVPVHVLVESVDQEQPTRPWQVVCVVCELHAWGVPLQFVVDHVHPYSPLQVVEFVFAEQGVTVPVHEPLLQLQ